MRRFNHWFEAHNSQQCVTLLHFILYTYLQTCNEFSCLTPFSGYIIFAIGFADADYGELVNIASKPSDRHVFFVDDLDAVKKIEEQLITFVCEAATASE